jgi:tetratricopeptide (TPR) repeat protein
VAACGFLPLAIRIAASRLASRRTWTVATLARKLSDERQRLDVLQVGDLAVKATFELGYGQLDAEQARAFRLLGLADGPDISLHAAAALLDRAPEIAEEVLESLVDASLLESAAPGRYRFHDLVRLFARACAERDENPPAIREAARVRLLDLYLTTTAGVYALQRPGDRLTAHLEETDYQGLDFDSPTAAVDWLFTEAECILSCVQQAANDGTRLRKAADLLLVGRDLSESGIFAAQYQRAAQALIAAAQAAGDPRAEGRARLALVQADSLAGRFTSAEEHGRHAGLLALACGDELTDAYAANERGIVAIYQSRAEDAAAHMSRALAAFRADGNRSAEASALGNLSRVNLKLGRTAEAVQQAREAVGILRSLGSDLRLANGAYTLGVALCEDGQPEAAITRLNDALITFRSHRQGLWEGMTYLRLAETHMSLGRPADAASSAEQALTQLRDVGGPWRRGHILRVLGQALTRIGQSDRGRACWQQALDIFERDGHPEAAEVRNLLASSTV